MVESSTEGVTNGERGQASLAAPAAPVATVADPSRRWVRVALNPVQIKGRNSSSFRKVWAPPKAIRACRR